MDSAARKEGFHRKEKGLKKDRQDRGGPAQKRSWGVVIKISARYLAAVPLDQGMRGLPRQSNNRRPRGRAEERSFSSSPLSTFPRNRTSKTNIQTKKKTLLGLSGSPAVGARKTLSRHLPSTREWWPETPEGGGGKLG